MGGEGAWSGGSGQARDTHHGARHKEAKAWHRCPQVGTPDAKFQTVEQSDAAPHRCGARPSPPCPPPSMLLLMMQTDWCRHETPEDATHLLTIKHTRERAENYVVVAE